MSGENLDEWLKEAIQAFQVGQLDQAEQHCLNILEQSSKNANAFNLLAAINFRQNQGQKALDLSSKAVSIAPNDALIQLGRSEILTALEAYDEALVAADRTLELNPDLAEAHLYRGISLTYLFRFTEARKAFDQALAINPDLDYVVKCKLAILLAEQGRYESARKLTGQLAEQNPTDSGMAWVRNRYSLHTPSVTRTEEKGIAQALWTTRQDQFGILQHEHKRDVRQRNILRIGYLSSDVNRHPVSIFLRPVIENRTRSDVYVKLYDVSPIKDDTSDDFRSLFDAHHDGLAESDQDLADRVYKDEIDLLVDVSGLQKSGRTSVFRHKPAPIQVSWIGYSGTNGLAETDYVIADQFVCPDGADEDFVERIVRLPNHYLCYAPPDVAVWPTETPAIKNKRVTFGSFNNTVKLNLEVIRVWAAILNRVPNSVLFLKSNRLKSPLMKEHVTRQFESFGVDRNRLQLKGFVGSNHHFAAYNDIDIALDPFPYCGTTTTVEALWMGVPVVTFVGERWIQRTSYGFLSGIGLDELCAYSESEYIETACALAQDVNRLSDYKAKIRPALLNSSICDIPQFTRDLENAYRAMWDS